MKNRVCVSVKPMADLERTDIPFGVYESDMAETVEPLKAADGKKESLFTVQGAVVRMLDLNEDELWRDEWQGKTFFRFEGLSGALEAELMRFVDSGYYCYTFMGEESPNPFNYGDAEDARFSRSAFYRWWKENPNGLPCPKWFDDLRRADESKQRGVNQSPVECVFELPEEPEECPPWGWSVPPPDDCWEVEHSDECREIEAPKVPAAALSVAPCVEGAGVDLSEAIAFGRSTRRILELIQDWLNRSPERKGPESQWRESLCRYLDHMARNEGWGKSTNDGGLSGAQWEGIQLIFLPAPIGLGGGSESWGGSCSLKNVKPKDRDKDKTKKSHK